MNNTITILLDRCFECGTIGELDFHHVVPKCKGGTNMIPLCLLCHSKVHGEYMLDFRKLAYESKKKKMKECKEKGIKNYFGRKSGKESIETLINKPKNKKIINLLKTKEFTIREIVKKTNSSLGTVMKLKHILYPKT